MIVKEVEEMVCPTCRHSMIVVEYKQIELDVCLNCHGTWFDQDELALLLESVTGKEESFLIQNILAAPAADTAERKRKCPVCGNRMKKVRVDGHASVLLDACTRSDGLWFDGGEVDQLVSTMEVRKPEKAEHDYVFSYMKEVFKTPAE
jgi:uncharacterized protein